jgi:hypothetical protein
MIAGRPFRLPKSFFAGVRAEVEKELAWLHDFLGKPVFSFDPDAQDDLVSSWSQDAIDSLAVLINAMAKDRKFSGARLMRLGQKTIGSPRELLRLALSNRRP